METNIKTAVPHFINDTYTQWRLNFIWIGIACVVIFVRINFFRDTVKVDFPDIPEMGTEQE